MGGFGSMHYMLEKPQMFKSISGLSSAFYTEEMIRERAGRNNNLFARILGDYNTNKEDYKIILHFDRIRKCAKEKIKLPPVYQHCGTEDRLLGINLDMYKLLRESGYQVDFKESEGKHNWEFWRDASAGVIGFHWKNFDK